MSKHKKRFRSNYRYQKQESEQNQVAFSPNDKDSETLETIEAKTEGQKNFIQAVKTNTLTVGIGPAGTGKTFLSIALALQALKEGTVSRIVLTRPIVEAGEKLGFLPGDAQEKINPYLRPMYDALNYMIGPGQYKALINREEIELAPIAYMRGRSLNDSFILVDEAQNMTVEQTVMLLTRLGQNSKMIVNGDITQIDLPKSKESGLIQLHSIIGQVPNVKFHYFDEKDVVRHPLVKDIVVAYAAWKKKNEKGK